MNGRAVPAPPEAHRPPAPSWNPREARAWFPAFAESLPLQWAHLDNAGGTYLCAPVLDHWNRFCRECKVQPFGPAALTTQAGERMQAGREAMAALLGVPPDCLTLGPSTTQNLNTLAAAWDPLVGPGDRLIVSLQDHEANIACWERLARRRGAEVVWWLPDPATGELALEDLESLLDERTRLVAVTQASNIVGFRNPVEAVAQLAHAAGARVVVDAVSSAPYEWPQPSALGADVVCMSTYKTFAVHVGVMYVAPDLLERLEPQCHPINRARPWARLDAAGPDHAAIAALAGLAEFFAALHRRYVGAMDAPPARQAAAVATLMLSHTRRLAARVLEALAELGVRPVGRPTIDGREPLIAIKVPQASSAALARALAASGLSTRHGHFYAPRLLQRLGIDDVENGVLRVSFAPYNTDDEVDRLIDALARALGRTNR